MALAQIGITATMACTARKNLALFPGLDSDSGNFLPIAR
jgi:hypothetical protein